MARRRKTSTYFIAALILAEALRRQDEPISPPVFMAEGKTEFELPGWVRTSLRRAEAKSRG